MSSKYFKFSLILCSTLALTFFIGSLLPNSLTWGVNFISFLPSLYIPIYLIFAAGLIIIFVKKTKFRMLEFFAGLFNLKPYLFLSIVITIYLIAAYLLRVGIPLLGDGMYVIKNFSEALSGISPLDLRNEPLSTAYFYGFVKLLNVSTYESLLTAFLIASMVLGISFIITLFFVCKNLFEKPSEKLLSFLFLLSFPYMQLFFGYVETYGVAIVAVAIYLLAFVLFMREKLSFSGVVVIFIIMGLAHYISLLLFPSLIYIAFLEYKKNKIRGVVKGTTIFLSIILILLLMINFDLQSIYAWTPHSHFLPVTSEQDALSLYTDSYTLFSPIHFSELVNYFILLGSTSIIIILAIGFKKKQILWESSTGIFFITTIVPLFLSIFILKFDLGLAKDWDVMAPYFPIVVLFAAWLASKIDLENIYRSSGLVIFSTMLISIFFISVQAKSDANLRRYQSLFDTRNVSNYGYYSSTLYLALYFHQIGNTQGAVDGWTRYTGNYPGDPQGYQNLVTNYKAQGPKGIPYCLNSYEQLLSILPGDTATVVDYITYCIDAGNYLFSQNEYVGASAVYKRAISLAPGYERPYNNLGSVFAQTDQADSAFVYFQQAIKLNPEYSDPYYNIAGIEESKGNLKKAKEYYQKAANLKNPSAIEKLKILNSRQDNN